nr:MAG TPA: hypothetical protein [Caudoviricetes sp.]
MYVVAVLKSHIEAPLLPLSPLMAPGKYSQVGLSRIKKVFKIFSYIKI